MIIEFESLCIGSMAVGLGREVDRYKARTTLRDESFHLASRRDIDMGGHYAMLPGEATVQWWAHDRHPFPPMSRWKASKTRSASRALRTRYLASRSARSCRVLTWSGCSSLLNVNSLRSAFSAAISSSRSSSSCAIWELKRGCSSAICVSRESGCRL